MLSVQGLNHFFGKSHILRDVSLEVGEECVGMFGPNGAGKTTLVNLVMGVFRAQSGRVEFQGRSISGLSPHQVVRLGIAVVPQERELFPFLSVYQNLELGAVFVPNGRRAVQQSLQEVFSLFPVLSVRRRQWAGTLSGGEQRMLAVGRALMSRPRLLILDEPSLGLQPSLVTDLFRTVRDIGQRMGVFVVEQNVRQALKAVGRGYVLENGAIVLAGTSEQLWNNDHVRKIYMGI